MPFGFSKVERWLRTLLEKHRGRNLNTYLQQQECNVGVALVVQGKDQLPTTSIGAYQERNFVPFRLNRDGVWGL
jgi:hypothetical protein